MNHWFACEIEEILLSPATGSRIVSRLDRGFAFTQGSEEEGFQIEAASEPFDAPLRALASSLERRPTCRPENIPDNVSVRALSRAAAVSDGEKTFRSSLQVFVLSTGSTSVVATPASLTKDLATLTYSSNRDQSGGIDSAGLPVAWQNGSGSVLIHEAIGHPAERGLFARGLPPWLRVEDSPLSGELVRIEADDTGLPVRLECLTDGHRPAALRRWSHRDVPARRMTNLVVRGNGKPLAELPVTRIDVHLVAHGFWDPSTDTFGVRVVAADFVDGSRRVPLQPFVYSSQRSDFARSLSGWFGEVTRHPGVLCGDEGVQLPVGSAATGLLTEGS